MSCQLTVRAVQKDRISPCAFASISVYKIIRFLWWDIPIHVVTLTADIYGVARFWLDKGFKYHIRTRWTGADARTRDWTEPIILTTCPWTMTVTAPW